MDDGHVNTNAGMSGGGRENPDCAADSGVGLALGDGMGLVGTLGAARVGWPAGGGGAPREAGGGGGACRCDPPRL